MRRALLMLAIAPAALVAGCEADVPAEPTYFADVQPLILARCARCHGADPLVSAISDFRLDRFVPDDDTTTDLWDMRDRVIEVAVDRESPAMPADYALEDRQKRLLQRWVELGAPRGERDNHPPELEAASALPASADESLAVEYRASDADSDGLRISVVAVGDEDHVLATGLGGALRLATVDTSYLLGDTDYDIELRADDGYAPEPGTIATTLPLGSITIDHGDRGATPLVTLTAPTAAKLNGTVDVTWTATDADPGDALTATVEVFRVHGDGTVELATTLATDIDAALGTTPFDTTTLDPGPESSYRYQITITVTDQAGNERTATSPIFRLAPSDS